MINIRNENNNIMYAFDTRYEDDPMSEKHELLKEGEVIQRYPHLIPFILATKENDYFAITVIQDLYELKIEKAL